MRSKIQKENILNRFLISFPGAGVAGRFQNASFFAILFLDEGVQSKNRELTEFR